ncbi:MAG: hypothetical protein FJ242_04680 [Nitrospira sp.]|nr:hypothetical protein [Nitrospira sp.]
MIDLMRYGVSPIGVGYVMPLKKDLREKIFTLLIKIDEIIKEAALKMIEDTVVSKEEKDETNKWIKAMLEILKGRASLLSSIYEYEVEKISSLVHEIEKLLE